MSALKISNTDKQVAATIAAAIIKKDAAATTAVSLYSQVIEELQKKNLLE